jgi:pyruvate dehydrogenase E2 component (dihydrolipoamide acetyltransferase)
MTGAIRAITMPKWGIEMTQGTVSGWRVRVGEQIERGAEILDVETEKIVNAVESPASGVLRRIVADSGDTRDVGALIGVIADPQISDAEIARFIDSFVGAVVTFEPDSEDVQQAAAPENVRVDQNSADGLVSPIARRVAERLGVDLARVVGTGRNGRISKEDVEAFAARGAGNETRRVRMSVRRLAIARNLLESKQSIPHFRLDIDVRFGPLLQVKRAYRGSERVTLNDWVLHATARALIEHPMLNAQLHGEEILQFKNADIAVAVTTEAGLITPIVRAANLKTVGAIALECRDLIERARLGTLKREEIAGASFTVSNLGMYGISRFDAIINAPQVAILAVGAISQRPSARDGIVEVADVATLTLSADHRVVDGAVGAAFLSTLRGILENPARLSV